MKPNLVDPDIITKGEIPALKEVEMSVAQDASLYLMSLMSGLYSNVIRAVIREYCTNAWDAHIEADLQRPIEVTLPTSLVPTFKVRDYGAGLSYDDILTYYARFGASTKRDSDRVTGMLGVGCKSALAYQDSFSVTSWHNGMKHHILIEKDNKGLGHVRILSKAASEEPSGLQVSIPVGKDDLTRFALECEHMFEYWPSGSVLVNGQRVKKFLAFPHIKITEDMYLVPGSSHHLVMGNIRYPLPRSFVLPIGIGTPVEEKDRWSLLVFVEIGTVDIAPSREALKDTRDTRLALAALRDAFDMYLDQAMENHIASARSYTEAYQRCKIWRDLLGEVKTKGLKFTWKGEVVPFSFTSDLDKPFFVTEWGKNFSGRSWRSNRKSWSVGKHQKRIYVDTAREGVWLWNFAPQSFVANHKKKLMHWCESQQLKPKHFVVYEGKRQDIAKFLDPKKQVDWEVIKAIKLPSDPDKHLAPPKPPLAFSCYYQFVGGAIRSGPLKLQDLLLQNIPYFVADLPEGKWQNSNWEAALKLRKHYVRFIVVNVPAQRRKKFDRDFPDARSLRREMERIYLEIKIPKGFIQKALLAEAVVNNAEHRVKIKRLDPRKVLDPELRAEIRMASDTAQTRTYTRLYELRALAKLAGKELPKSKGIKLPSSRYPLLLTAELLDPASKLFKQRVEAQAQIRDHIYEYVNHIYTTREQSA